MSILTSIIEWLESIINPLLNFFVSILDGLIRLFKIIPKIISLISGSVGYVPSYFALFLSLSIMIMIVYIILGRDLGES